MNIDDRTLTRSGRVLSGVSVAVALFGMAALVAWGRWDLMVEEFALHSGALAVGFGALVWVTITAQARNGAIWALGGSAFFAALSVAGVVAAALYGHALTDFEDMESIVSDVPLLAAAVIQPLAWAWIPALFLFLTLGLLLFPDGRPPSPRWRWVGRVSVVAIVLAVGSWIWITRPSRGVPLGASPSEGALVALAGLMFFVILACVVLSVAALIVRYRRSSGVTRRQIRWIAWGGTVFAAVILWTFLLEGEGGSVWWMFAAEALLIVSFAVAISKYRLYDIDLVISRTVTFGALALFITAVYVAIVVGIGTLVGQGDEPNLALAIAATAVVALLFQPMRSWVRRWANRLVYGERTTPYSVLSELTARLSEAQSNEQALGRLAELLASGTGAEEAAVWLQVGDRLRPEATTYSGLPAAVDLDGDGLPDLPGDAAEPIHHGGELLGALSISKAKADPVTPADRQLLQDVAAGAGLLLRNIQLNAELADRAIELRTSRRRLVAAQDSERRRLERNLHDGAQQQVVALKVKLGLAETLAEREDVPQVAEAVGDLAGDAQRAVDGMRAAARGIYPPLLEAEGVRAALVAAGREAAIPVEIAADGFGRYPPEIEATIYFCVLEALGHASKGSPNVARVSLGDDGESLKFSVHNASHGSGRGPGLTAVADRLEALGGTLTVEATTSGGTMVTGRLPARSLEPL